MSIFGKSKRRVYARKIKGFWEDFSHNKIGFAGLSIILLYVVVALLAPYITDYQPLRPPRVAGRYAPPEWLKLFPAYQDWPPTIRIPLNNWSETQNYETISLEKVNSTQKIHFTNNGSTGELEYYFEINTDYNYQAPDSFELVMAWTARRSNLSYRLETYIVTPDGESYMLLGQDYDIVTQRIIVLPSSWNIVSTSLTTTSGSIDLRRRLFYEDFYIQFYEEALADYEEGLYDSFSNSTYNTRRSLWLRANGTLDGFEEWWVVYWSAYGEELWDTFWTARLPQAQAYADALAKAAADNEANNLTPQTIIFDQTGTYKLLLKLIIIPSADTAALDISFPANNRLRFWGKVHGLLGTDSFGGDVWVQLVFGAQVSLLVGVLSALLSTSLGILFGVVSGYVGGLVDEFTMRVVDVLLCLPVLPILLALSSYFSPNVYFIVVIIAIFGWQGLSRVIRSRVLSLREMPFVESAKAAGGDSTYLIRRHLIPNVFPIAMAAMVLAVPGAILTEAALSFLGFGDPTSPTWGKMLYEAQQEGAFKALAFHYILPPGLAITVLCVAFVFLGHALDEIVNPRLRRRR
jgi:ABC-type dipeptide/oligopeptide/nickel transport system permease subunit